MKIKGITFWEQHTEHFVIGIAALVFVGFTAMQFMGNPNAVQVGGKTVGPGDVDGLIEKEASRIADDITNGSGDVPPQAPLLEKYKAQTAAGIGPKSSLAAWAPSIGVGTVGSIDLNRPFVVASIPAPTGLEGQQFFDTINADVVAELPDLAKIVPNNPRDISWNTIAAKFDIGSVLRQYSQGGSNGEAPLPDAWTNRRVDILDVKVEREEQLSDGTWGKHILLDPIPGQLNYRIVMAKPVDANERNRIIAQVGDPSVRLQIIQPEFYNTVSSQWSPPGSDPTAHLASKAGEDPAIAEYKSAIARYTKELDRQKKLLKDKGCPENPEPEKPGAGKPGGAPPPPPAGGKGAGGGPPGPAGAGASGRAGGMRGDGASKADESACKRIRKTIKGLEDKIAKAEADLAKLLPKEDQPEAKVDAPKAKPGDDTGDVLQVWAHDLAIVPGHVYRYRFTIEVYNPVFARKLDLREEQRPLAEKLTLVSKPSEWSAPMMAHPPLRVFITAASPAGQNAGIGGKQGLGEATAEVFRFYDGRWWRQTFTVQPGDRIGSERATRVAEARSADPKEKPEGVKPKAGAGGSDSGEKESSAPPPPPIPIDYGTDWFVLDVVEDVGSDDADVKKRAAAVVLLQSLGSSAIYEYRLPRADGIDPEFRRLKEELRLSESGDDSLAKVN